VPELIVRVKVPDALMDPVLRVVERLVGLEVVTVTFPANPFNAATVIVEAPGVPMFSETDDGLAETVKSPTV
jgi:hypothetical protein